MKKFTTIFLAIILLLTIFVGCDSSNELTEEQIQEIVQAEIKKFNEENQPSPTPSPTPNNTNIFGTPEDDYTKYFNYGLVDGKYCALSIKQGIEIPEILVVPNSYNGIEVAYTGSELISGLPVKTIIFESGVECSNELCGNGNNCPTLENIVILSKNPKDSIYGKLRLINHFAIALQLNHSQYYGGCKIYVPNDSVNEYKDAWTIVYPEYCNLIHPISELDESLAKYIK